ncbi:MAG: aspartate kinase, partial [Acidimicrobiia bacterium]|nr:aspartate kinase [Acidimicrobiia bacterium]
ITTLGRGGSDTSAVALAAALGGDVAEIYTDVPGVMTSDPRIVPEAQKLEEISYEEMMELAAGGAGVLVPRAVEVGRRYGVPIHVRSSFTDSPGTWIRKATEMERMEQAIVSGIAHDSSEAKITLREVPDQPGVAASIFEPLAEASVNVDMIVQNISREGLSDISFTIPKSSMDWAEEVVRLVGRHVKASGVEIRNDIAKVSLIGAGMKTEPGVAARVFRTLGEAGINIEMISTSTIRISCVVEQSQMQRAVQALHREFRPPLIREEQGA